jgi:hypothetical protein
MSTPPATLDKIKKLLSLTQSSNPNEAENARAMVDKLVAKYGVTEEELSSLEEKVYYGEDEKLFVTLGIVGWRQQLALAVATFFDCQIVQEELVPAEGIHQFNYYVYGDPDQVRDTQFVYHAFAKKIEKLADYKCLGRGDIYIDSYCEGVIDSVKWNIKMFGIDLPDIKRPIKKQEETLTIKPGAITKTSSEKDEPTDKRVDVNNQSLVKDVMAFYRGVDDGADLSLKDILQLEVTNEESRRLKEATEEAQEHSIQPRPDQASERQDS